jgi:hypothetical protein
MSCHLPSETYPTTIGNWHFPYWFCGEDGKWLGPGEVGYKILLQQSHLRHVSEQQLIEMRCEDEARMVRV